MLVPPLLTQASGSMSRSTAGPQAIELHWTIMAHLAPSCPPVRRHSCGGAQGIQELTLGSKTIGQDRGSREAQHGSSQGEDGSGWRGERRGLRAGNPSWQLAWHVQCAPRHGDRPLQRQDGNTTPHTRIDWDSARAGHQLSPAEAPTLDPPGKGWVSHCPWTGAIEENTAL